jgi:hypothetical protein
VDRVRDRHQAVLREESCPVRTVDEVHDIDMRAVDAIGIMDGDDVGM